MVLHVPLTPVTFAYHQLEHTTTVNSKQLLHATAVVLHPLASQPDSLHLFFAVSRLFQTAL